jgi:hypothetical protein
LRIGSIVVVAPASVIAVAAAIAIPSAAVPIAVGTLYASAFHSANNTAEDSGARIIIGPLPAAAVFVAHHSRETRHTIPRGKRIRRHCERGGGNRGAQYRRKKSKLNSHGKSFQ